jgi:hypothetical protein
MYCCAAHQRPRQFQGALQGAEESKMRAVNFPLDHEALGLCRLFLPTGEAGSAAAARPADRPRKPTLMERLERWFAEARQREVERYLAQSSDVFDLERRIRALERQPYYGLTPG